MTNPLQNSPNLFDPHLDLIPRTNKKNIKSRFFFKKLLDKANDYERNTNMTVDTPANLYNFMMSDSYNNKYIDGYEDNAFHIKKRIARNETDGAQVIHPEWLLYFAQMASDLGGTVIGVGNPVFNSLQTLSPISTQSIEKILLLFFSNLILKYEVNGNWYDLGNEPIYNSDNRLKMMTKILFKDSLTISNFLHSIQGNFDFSDFHNIVGKTEDYNDAGDVHNPLFKKSLSAIGLLPIVTIPIPLFGFNPLDHALNNTMIPVPVGGGGVLPVTPHPMIILEHIARPVRYPTFCQNTDDNTRGINLCGDDLHPLSYSISLCHGDFRYYNIIEKFIKYVQKSGILNVSAMCNTFKNLIMYGAMEEYNLGVAGPMPIDDLFGPKIYVNLENHKNLKDSFYRKFQSIATGFSMKPETILSIVTKHSSKLWCSSAMDGGQGFLLSDYSAPMPVAPAITPVGAGAGAALALLGIHANKVAVLAAPNHNPYQPINERPKLDNIDYQVLLSSPETIIMQLYLFTKHHDGLQDLMVQDHNLQSTPNLLNELLALQYINAGVTWNDRPAVAANTVVPLLGRIPFAIGLIPDADADAYRASKNIVLYNTILNNFYKKIIYPLIFFLYNLRKPIAAGGRNIVYNIPDVDPGGGGAPAGATPAEVLALQALLNLVGCPNTAIAGGGTRMYYLNENTAPYNGIEYDAYIYITQILNTDPSTIRILYTRLCNGPGAAYGTAPAGAGAPIAFNGTPVDITDIDLVNIIDELFKIELLQADNGLAAGSNSVLAWTKDNNYKVMIRDFVRDLMVTMPPTLIKSAAWGVTLTATELHNLCGEKLNILVNNVLKNPVNHRKFQININEFKLLGNIMEEYLKYYKELRTKFLLAYTSNNFFNIDLIQLMTRKIESDRLEKGKLKGKPIVFSDRLDWDRDPHYAMFPDDKTTNKQREKYIYDDEKLYKYDSSKPDNKGVEITFNDSIVKFAVDRKCDNITGLSVQNKSPDEEEQTCAEYLMNCIEGTDDNNIEKCKEYMISAEYWEKAAAEADKIDPLMALKTLKAFGFETINTDDDEFIQMMSFDDWLDLLIKNKSIGGPKDTIDTEGYKIQNNIKLKGYLIALVNRINYSLGITNPKYVKVDKKRFNPPPRKHLQMAYYGNARGGSNLYQYNKFALGGRPNNIYDTMNDMNRIMETHTYNDNINQYGGYDFDHNQKLIKGQYNLATSSVYKNMFNELTNELKKKKQSLVPNDIQRIGIMISDLQKREKVFYDILLAYNTYAHWLSIHGDKSDEGSTLSYNQLEKLAVEKRKILSKKNKAEKNINEVFNKLILVINQR
jgi:hypothetical protein